MLSIRNAKPSWLHDHRQVKKQQNHPTKVPHGVTPGADPVLVGRRSNDGKKRVIKHNAPAIPDRCKGKGDNAQFQGIPFKEKQQPAGERSKPCKGLHETLPAPGIVGQRGQDRRKERHQDIGRRDRPRIEHRIDDFKSEKRNCKSFP
jgi:hypothetical protein